MNVALVTGASGFLGRHVCSQVHNEGDQVHSLSGKADAREAGVLRIPEKPSVEDFRRVIDETRPDTIYHLAGTSMSSDLAQLYQTNVILAQTILSAVAATGAKVKVVLIGSAAEYGEPVDPQGIVRETDRCRPVSAYGISKLAQTLHGLAAAGAGLDVTIARLFNPIGPGSGTNTALGSFVHQVTSLRGGPGVLKTGSLDSVRDFIEIGEAARAIVALSLIHI